MEPYNVVRDDGAAGSLQGGDDVLLEGVNGLSLIFLTNIIVAHL